MATIDINGVKTYYTEHGNGKPLIFVHGAFVSEKTWYNQIPYFAMRGYKVITYDARGHGRSGPARTAFSVSDLGNDLAMLIRKLDLKDYSLVGFSMGGMIILQALADGRITPQKAIICDSPFDIRGDRDIFIFKRLFPRFGILLLLRFTTPVFWINMIFNAIKAYNPDSHWMNSVSADNLRLHMAEMKRASMIKLTDALYRFNHIPVKFIKTPMLVIRGDKEAGFFVRQAKLLQQRVAGPVKEVVIKDAGHDSNEAKALEFNQAIENFLQESP